MHRGFRQALLAWFDRHARPLPWRTRPRDPYAVWVSEIMLQQTRVSTVIPYFERFMAKFPTVDALAGAPLDEVLAVWSGLGYYRRARAMHRAAGQLIERGDRSLPSRYESLLELSGIGQYTAAAIASIAFGEAVAVVDGNVLRVLARVTLDDDPVDTPRARRRIQKVADELVDPNRPGDFNEAMMELGATTCTPTSPACLTCPVRAHCGANREGRVDALPVVSKRKPSPSVRLDALVIRHGQRVLLCRRKADGLFGGLWEPPMVQAPSGDYRRMIADAVGGKAIRTRGRVQHVLTHRVLDVTVWRWTADDARRVETPEGYDETGWFTAEERAALGVSALAKKVLERG